MCCREMGIGMVLGLLVLPGQACPQSLVWNDQRIHSVFRVPVDSGESLLRMRITQQLDYALTLSGSIFTKGSHDPNTSQVLLIQDLLYQCQGETPYGLSFSEKIIHHLGLQYFIDSTFQFHLDDNQFETKVVWKIRKHHGFFVSCRFSTRLFDKYLLMPDDSGCLVPVLSESFLTPLTGLFSGGFQFKWPMVGSLDIGLSSAKLIWVGDKKIYRILGTDMFYGIPEEKRCLFEYGLSLQVLIRYQVARWLQWDCDLQIFKKTDLPPDVSMKNYFGFQLAKHLKASFQTRIFYEERVSKKLQLENIVSAGFLVSL